VKHLPLAIVLVSSAGVSLGVPSCSEANRYKALSFFFDGVPEPGAPPREKRVRKGPGVPLPPVPAERRPEKSPVFAHPPYRDDRCRECHDPNGRWLIRTAEEGLCGRCHPDVPGSVAYVHGPVATRACLTCHHYHSSSYQWVLLVSPAEICLRCHERGDLSSGVHHRGAGEQTCIECHDPHGGDNPNLLRKRGLERGE
jgi:predicted CXXCH cytochrome family protein